MFIKLVSPIFCYFYVAGMRFAVGPSEKIAPASQVKLIPEFLIPNAR